MAGYLLDTNSQLTVAELMVGFEYSKLKNGIDQTRRLKEFLKYVCVIPIDDILPLAAHEKARLQLAGTPAHDLIDVLIACTAIQNNLVMVTENTKHFCNFDGIVLENWVQRDVVLK